MGRRRRGHLELVGRESGVTSEVSGKYVSAHATGSDFSLRPRPNVPDAVNALPVHAFCCYCLRANPHSVVCEFSHRVRRACSVSRWSDTKSRPRSKISFGCCSAFRTADVNRCREACGSAPEMNVHRYGGWALRRRFHWLLP